MQNTAKQNYPGSVASLSQEMRWAYSTTPPSPHEAEDCYQFVPMFSPYMVIIQGFENFCELWK